MVSFEEDEALKRPSSSDSKLYFDTCKNIRTLLSEIHDLKSQQVDAETSAKATAKCMQACSLIVVLKKLNRLDKVRTIAAREALTTEKQKVDSTNLQYHNLLYEAAHLTSEYKKCQQFKYELVQI